MLNNVNQNLATAEAVRAVQEDDGVMGMFVTGEHDKPNIIHVMELYRDRGALVDYAASSAAKAFFQKTESMFISSRIVENLETKIPLSTKGFHSNAVTK
ncbi:MAG: hypothetical protein E7197_01660 [Anaerovibrio sp.]|uniref:hypothetical protein n=1 Tax=Anaerovibrio sp. TaxID=1872532 RepID=UPI0025C38880|nr:hypothetical protein [Anaerovibrio sp.]MBE6098741.1 hypothetical protein [Anaerovibrio sp.]